MYEKAPFRKTRASGSSFSGIAKILAGCGNWASASSGQERVVEVAEPVNLKEFLATAPRTAASDLAQQIRRELIYRLDVQRRVITGPVMKSREEVMELTLTDPALTRSWSICGDQEKESLQDKEGGPGLLLGDVRRSHVFYVNTMHRLVSWLSRHLFDGIAFDNQGFEKVRQASKRGSLIFVPCHKSHLDYLILTT